MPLIKLIPENNKKHFCNNLFQKIESFGLGSFSKADFDALIYYLLDVYKDENQIRNNYDWMNLLKVTPTKLRSMQLISSIKYHNLENSEENWSLVSKAIIKERIEIDDSKKGTVRFFIDNTHIYRFIEKFVVDQGSSLDYKRNTNQLVIKYDIFIDLINEIKDKLNLDENQLIKDISLDKSFKEIENVFNSPINIFNEFKSKFKDKAFDEIATTAIKLMTKAVIKYLKSKFKSD